MGVARPQTLQDVSNADALDPVVEVAQEEDTALGALLQANVLPLIVVLGDNTVRDAVRLRPKENVRQITFSSSRKHL